MKGWLANFWFKILKTADVSSQTSILPTTENEEPTAPQDIKIHLIPDKWHLNYVGKLENGRLFWADMQLGYDHKRKDTRDFICIWIFDADGTLIDHRILDRGFRSEGSVKKPNASDIVSAELSQLGEYNFTDIWVKPFSVEKYDLEFGLVAREVGDGPNEVVFDAAPGLTLMFYPPWKDGRYDT